MTVSISILVPVFNCERYIEEALFSVMSQLGEHDEIIVQDGASTDRTAEVVRRVSAGEHRISLVTEPDSGQSDALTRALLRSSGTYIGWLNGDDLIRPGTLDAVRDRAEVDDHPQLIYGDFDIVTAAGAVTQTFGASRLSHAKVLRYGCYLFSGACFFERQSLVEVGYDRNLHYCMDFDLLLRWTEGDSRSWAQVSRTFAAFRDHDESKTGSAARKFVPENVRVRRAALKREGRTDRISFVKYIICPAVRQSATIATTGLRSTNVYRRLRGRNRVLGKGRSE